MAGERDSRNERDQTQAATVAVTALLLAGFPREEFTSRLAMVLLPLGVPPAVTVLLIQIVGWPDLTFGPEPVAVEKADGRLAAIADRLRGRRRESAGRIMRRGRVARRAAYLVAAAKRLAKGGRPRAEAKLLAAHKLAERRRVDAAERIDQAAGRHGQVLGWHAVLDERTTPLCRAAHGRNFRVDRPPEIGWPGTQHAGNCRCRPGAPWPDGSMLP